MSQTLTPAQRRLRKRKREAQVGLANNAFGATAGAVATAQAFRAAPRTKEAMEATRTGRFLLRTKINPRVAIPAAGTALVGMQLANGAMDAQSAQYFGRELKTISGKEKRMEARLAKSYEEITVGAALPETDGIGRNIELVEKGLPSALRQIDRTNRIPSTVGQKGWDYIGPRVAAHRRGKEAAKRTYKFTTARGTTGTAVTDTGSRILAEGRWDRATSRSRLAKSMSLVEVSKKVRRFDPEADRQRRLGAYQGAGIAGAVGLGALSAIKARKLTKAQLSQLLAAGNLVKVPAGLAAGAAGSGALALGAHRRATSARNERWT